MNRRARTAIQGAGRKKKDAASMAETRNIQAVRGFFAAQHADYVTPAFSDHILPDFRFVVSSARNEELRALIPWAGYEHRGLEGFQRLNALLFSEYELLTFEILRLTEAQDQVFAEGHFRLRHRETAKVADSDFLARFDMRCGKIAAGQFYDNTAAIAEARRTI